MIAHRVMLVGVLVGFAAPSARAQGSDTTARSSALSCPQAGLVARLWTGTTADSANRERPAASAPSATMPRSGGAIDTVITLNIRDRTWQRDTFAAGVALGVAGSAGTRGAPWHACAGATATFGHVAATLHNVQGQIHLKADPAALDAIGGTTRGTTPPAPPRR
jgi:hypothetical protein